MYLNLVQAVMLLRCTRDVPSLNLCQFKVGHGPFWFFSVPPGKSWNTTLNYHISRPIRRTMFFSLGILEKNNDECILILLIYWKKTGLLHNKISNHNIIYSS